MNHTAQAIYDAYEAARGESYEGLGISISLLGEECERALWYGFRWASEAEKIDGLKAITFETGNIEEERLLGNLRMIGCEVVDVDENGRQVRAEAVAGHVRGKLDGKVLGLPEAPKTWHVVECKSSKETYYKKIVKEGVRKGYYTHFIQLNTYGHIHGFDRGLYMCRNKNTGEIHVERIEIDHEEAIRILARAERIICAPNPPPKLHEDPSKKSAFKCGWCRHKAICHEAQFARVHCRTCLHSKPEMIGNAAWSCARWGKPLSADEQRTGCGAHLFLPSLVPGELLDASDEEEWVEYRLKDGSTWRDGGKTAEGRRYWHHPESGCVFTTESGEQAASDGLVEEIEADEFARLLALYAQDREQV